MVRGTLSGALVVIALRVSGCGRYHESAPAVEFSR